jgi:hypothetical protein
LKCLKLKKIEIQKTGVSISRARDYLLRAVVLEANPGALAAGIVTDPKSLEVSIVAGET